jgi:hypothetical protein
LIREKSKEYKYGSLLYLYYSYINKFHTEPQDIESLLEFSDFCKIESGIHKLVADYTKQTKEK